jgi:hypothetical protein
LTIVNAAALELELELLELLAFALLPPAALLALLELLALFELLELLDPEPTWSPTDFVTALTTPSVGAVKVVASTAFCAVSIAAWAWITLAFAVSTVAGSTVLAVVAVEFEEAVRAASRLA